VSEVRGGAINVSQVTHDLVDRRHQSSRDLCSLRRSQINKFPHQVRVDDALAWPIQLMARPMHHPVRLGIQPSLQITSSQLFNMASIKTGLKHNCNKVIADKVKANKPVFSFLHQLTT